MKGKKKKKKKKTTIDQFMYSINGFIDPEIS